jgi:arylsulfatase A-like enzyme
VIVLADDLGWADVGWHALDGIATPNLDALAKSALVLDRFYTAPLCSPARAGLLTGRSPLRMGILRNLAAQEDAGLPLDEQLLPQVFRRAGYATAMVGKWHLGSARPEQHPNARGFEHFYGHLSGWVDYFTHEHNAVLDWQRDGVAVREAGYTTRLLSDEAVRILADRDRTRPLLLYVALNAPHPPLEMPPGGKIDAQDADHAKRSIYKLVVAEMDRAIGVIAAAIDRSDRARDTILFFASDNGADLRFGGSNAPLREGKATVFEGAIRTPAFLRWPGRVTPGTSPTVVTHLDVFPTLAGAAGIDVKVAKPLDGKNLWSTLAGGAAETPATHVFACERPAERRYAALFEHFKLVETIDKSGATRDLLFDVFADPSEEHDVLASHPDVVGRQRDELRTWEAMPRLSHVEER